MAITVRMRCEGCGAVLKTSSTNAGRSADCPKCEATFRVPHPPPSEARQSLRAIVEDVGSQPQASESSSTSGKLPVYKVVYTEVDPAQFVLARRRRVPVLDVSSTGLRFLARVDEQGSGLASGQMILIEIDFPIFVRPVKTLVEVRWTKPLEGYELQQVGVEFSQPDREFREIIGNLVDFVLARQ